MPHIILEYSLAADDAGLDATAARTLVDAAFNAVLETAVFTPANIKVRLHPVQFYRLGLANAGFIHVMCRIHRGKNLAQKHLLSESLLQALSKIEAQKRVITVEVVEMDRESYAKGLT